MTTIVWPDSEAAGRARRDALVAIDTVNADILFRTVDYRSSGRILVTGPGDRVAAFQRHDVPEALDVTMLITDMQKPAALADSDRVFLAPLQELSGYLGGFRVIVNRDDRDIDLGELCFGEENANFDMVIDLHQPRRLEAELAAFGYYSPGDGDGESAALVAAAEMVGDFQKPRFFNYNPDICAHGRAGITGCSKCIDSCPADAIVSIGEQVEVNAHLCQGGGVCATACPSGAMTYAYPPVVDLLGGLRTALREMTSAGVDDVCVLFYDDTHGVEIVQAASELLPQSVLAIAVEEVGSVGLDTWLSALVWGAASVRILVVDQTPLGASALLKSELEVASAMLDGAGHEPRRIEALGAADAAALAYAIENANSLRCLDQLASHAPASDKRGAIRIALDHLIRSASTGASIIELPANAAFGEVKVDTERCTLCMSCASVCPVSAITAGGDTPALRFTEFSCVQCGTCEIACPEDAISLAARYLGDNDQRMSSRTLHEEEPFHCVSCGKAFATASVMARMQEKLSGHWMFQNPEQMNRLKMCEDCRVKNMFIQEGGLTPTDREPR